MKKHIKQQRQNLLEQKKKQCHYNPMELIQNLSDSKTDYLKTFKDVYQKNRNEMKGIFEEKPTVKSCSKQN